jgi:hypothetical protein
VSPLRSLPAKSSVKRRSQTKAAVCAACKPSQVCSYQASTQVAAKTSSCLGARELLLLNDVDATDEK